MSLPKNVVSVDLGNLPRPVALDLLDASVGASVVAYADPSGHARLTLPYSASDTDGTVVKFYVDADEVWLSAKVNGHEVADAGGTTKYVVADPHRSDAAPAVQLEWNADRLNQAAPSGGSTPVQTRGAYSDTTGVNADSGGAITLLPWVFASGDELLDLTDPRIPLVLAAGVYAVSATIQCAAVLAPATVSTELDIDSNDVDAFVDDTRKVDTTGLSLDVPLSLTWYCPAGGALQVGVSHDIGSAHNFKLITAWVQRLS